MNLKKPSLQSAGFVVLLLALFCGPVRAGFWDQVGKILKESSPQKKEELSSVEMARGLKEALWVGIERAVSYLSNVENLLKNPSLRIPPPPKVAKVTGFLRKVGFKKQVEDFERSLNAAAAKAIKEALPVFKEAISSLTIEDAKRLLRGGDTAITNYFREKTSRRLYERFRPIVKENLVRVGVTKKYQELIQNSYARNYLGGTDLDLEHYVTKAALDRLFKVLAQEEIKIRRNPAARTTELLKKVFSSL